MDKLDTEILNEIQWTFPLVAKPFDEIAKKFENTVLCETEAQLLNTFIHLIQDADILSGWNSEGFDIPYIVRTKLFFSQIL